MFILTPTISTGGIPNKDMVEQLRRKHERPEYGKDLQDTIMDPLGFDARKQRHQDKLQELEEQHRQASIEKRKAEQSLREAQEEVAQAQQSAETEKEKAAAAISEAE